MDTKICTKCGEEKELSEFYKKEISRNSFYSNCKECCKKYYQNNKEKIKENVKKYKKNNPEKVKKCVERWIKNNPKKYKEQKRQWAKNNSEKIKKNYKQWVKNNIEKVILYKRKWYKKNLEKLKEKYKKYNQNNREKIKEQKKEYYKNNKEKIKEKSKKWYQNNSEKIKENARKWAKNNRKKINKHRCNRKKTDIHFKLRGIISCLIRMRLKNRLLNKNGKSTWSFLPYTVDDLIKHLESLFESWMNWQNYGKKRGYWTIDHIKPDSLFNYKSVEDEEFQKCWALDNLQPMEYIENIKKGKKISNV